MIASREVMKTILSLSHTQIYSPYIWGTGSRTWLIKTILHYLTVYVLIFVSATNMMSMMRYLTVIILYSGSLNKVNVSTGNHHTDESWTINGK